MNIFFVRALYGQYTDIFRQNGFVAIGWFGKDQVEDYTSKESIMATYKRHNPTHTANQAGQNVGQIYRFWNEIKPKDLVITTYADGRLLIGEVKGTPYFKEDHVCDFYERIDVNWRPDIFDRYTLSYPMQATLRSSLTVFRIWQIAEIATLAGYTMPELAPSHTHTDSKVVNEAIRQQLLQLDDKEFEVFVSYLLQSIGFEAEQRHGWPGDKGIDVTGRLDVFGVTSLNLQVQVKRYAHAPIREPEIRNLRGSAKDGHQLTFITLSNFHKSATESAVEPQKKPVTLVNGDKLVALFAEHFEKVVSLIESTQEDEIQKEMASRLLRKLRFRRIIVPI